MNKHIFLLSILSLALCSFESSAMRTRGARILAQAWGGSTLLTDNDIKQQADVARQTNTYQYQTRKQQTTYEQNTRPYNPELQQGYHNERQQRDHASTTGLIWGEKIRSLFSSKLATVEAIRRVRDECKYLMNQSLIALKNANNDRNLDNNYPEFPNRYDSDFSRDQKCDLPPASPKVYEELRDLCEKLFKDAPSIWSKSTLEKREQAISKITNGMITRQRAERFYHENKDTFELPGESKVPMSSSKEQKNAPESPADLKLLQTIFEPILKGDILCFLSQIHGSKEDINFCEMSPNIFSRAAIIIEGMVYDENGTIKETLTEQEQHDINTIYKDSLCFKFNSLPTELSHELRQLSAQGYVEFQDCAHIEYVKESNTHYRQIRDKLIDLEERYKKHVEQGHNNPINQHIFNTFKMSKEDALAYAEKHAIFQTYPWLRRAIDPSLKQKAINDLQQHKKMLKLGDYYAEILQKHPELPQQMVDRLRTRHTAIEQSTTSRHLFADPLRQVISNELNTLSNNLETSIADLTTSELGLIYSKAQMLMDLAKDLEHGGYFDKAFNTLDRAWIINDAAQQLGSDIYTHQAGQLFENTQNIYSQFSQVLQEHATHDDLNREALVEQALTRGFIKGLKKAVIDLPNCPARVANGIINLAVLFDHHCLDDVALKYMTGTTIVVDLLAGNIARNDKDLESLKDNPYSFSYGMFQRLEEREQMPTVADIARAIYTNASNELAKERTFEEFLLDSEHASEFITEQGLNLLVDLGFGKLCSKGFSSLNEIAGDTAEKLGQAIEASQQINNDGTVTLVATEAAITESDAVAHTIKTTSAILEAGALSNAADKLAIFKKGKNDGGSSKSKTVPNKKFDGINRKWGDKQVPDDYHTILKNDPEFIPTNYTCQKAKIYKKGKLYYYRDNLHQGAGAHLEVFDKTGKKHLGEANPLTGIIDFSQADPKKKPIF